MKIKIDIPDSIIPENIRDTIKGGDLTEEQHRQIVEVLLRMTCDRFDECEISVGEYRLVLK